ncbi:MAG TPA: hypothetical protein PLA90_17550, partial [Candidatus Sumerlaeota bacterium]|nr:hypothetical protein [Candidatus Sumerlaeota bacterium]
DEKEEKSTRYAPALGSRLRGNDGKESIPEKNPFVYPGNRSRGQKTSLLFLCYGAKTVLVPSPLG